MSHVVQKEDLMYIQKKGMWTVQGFVTGIVAQFVERPLCEREVIFYFPVDSYTYRRL